MGIRGFTFILTHERVGRVPLNSSANHQSVVDSAGHAMVKGVNHVIYAHFNEQQRLTMQWTLLVPTVIYSPLFWTVRFGEFVFAHHCRAFLHR